MEARAIMENRRLMNHHIDPAELSHGTVFEAGGELREHLRCSHLLCFDKFDAVCNMVRLVDYITEHGYNMTVQAFNKELEKGTLKLYERNN